MEFDAALALVNRIYVRLNARRPRIDVFEDYLAGRQPLSFATDEWRKANAARYDGFSDNWCRPVVDAEAERIRHTGIKIGGGENAQGDGDKAANALWEQWLMNEMEMQSSQGFVTTLTDARSFVLVWGNDDDQPVVTWEHPSSVEIEYDWANPRKRTAALKTWIDETTEYANLYTADELMKFQRPRPNIKNDRTSQKIQARPIGAADGGGWVVREVPGEPWPVRNPMGEVPIVEFPNRPLLAADPVSEIQGVIPMQDAINLLWAYLFLSADFASMPARVVLHQGPPKTPILDENGVKIGEKPIDMQVLQEKRLLYLSGQDTTIDSWEAAKLSVFTDVIELAVGHIASQTRTPPTQILTLHGMSNVNGEGLKAAEIGLVKKTLEFETFASAAMREVYRLIALAMGDVQLAQQARLATIAWMNPEIRSEAQLADALLKKKAIGYPVKYLLELDGVDPKDVERVMGMIEAERTDPQLSAAMRGLDGSSNGGGAVPGAAGSVGDNNGGSAGPVAAAGA